MPAFLGIHEMEEFIGDLPFCGPVIENKGHDGRQILPLWVFLLPLLQDFDYVFQ